MSNMDYELFVLLLLHEYGGSLLALKTRLLPPVPVTSLLTLTPRRAWWPKK